MSGRVIWSALAVGLLVLPSALAQEQATEANAAAEGATSGAATGEASAGVAPVTRQEIFECERWSRLMRSFDEWLSVQNIYTDEEIAQLKAKLDQRISAMSAAELVDFVIDSEDRLDLLLSDEAADARSYLNFLTDAARRKMIAKDGKVPDAFGLTVAQLRQELRQFQQQRAGLTAAQADSRRMENQRSAALVRQRSQQRLSQEQFSRPATGSGASQHWQRQEAVRSQYAPKPQRPPDVWSTIRISPGGGIWRTFPGPGR